MKELNEKKRKLEQLIPMQIREYEKEIQQLKNEVKKKKINEIAPVGPNLPLLEYITRQIEAKERELECPVCFEVASSPIFMCSEDHLVCSDCRTKLSQCPEQS